jgi:hypothetical protein
MGGGGEKTHVKVTYRYKTPNGVNGVAASGVRTSVVIVSLVTGI